MKTLVSFFVIAVLTAVACFALLYGIFKLDYSDALVASVSVAVSGFVVDNLMKYTNSRKRKST
jgi:Kef-type K+ transport system membrane component KefB